MKRFLLVLIFFIPEIALGQNKYDSLALEYFKNKLSTESFDISFNKKDIPGFIKHKFTEIDKTKFKIASKGKSFNSGDAILRESLPNKRVVYIAHIDGVYIITYEQGGFGTAYYTRLIKYDKRRVNCLITLQLPPHEELDEFRQILKSNDQTKYVANKSLCVH
jgi:hypothetical protein